ncbi:PREDICTED: uncharacterized protein LOC109355347 isoform X2 [Lupinus angustifolius]|uniref:uncharacterized protein LOC109355347 isoform X2 n=1 Tax=Lupinus angustifolius TaxID=3871 RepID=UPI00092EE51C|nr:PREDICTED: uncharacterized protein LOC109355347 isoform X2 [Lupinus angustifolius]
MDSISKLQPLDFTDEDDSLLINKRDEDCSTVFSCSPLISINSKSRTEARSCDVDSQNLSFTPAKDHGDVNKDNVNWSAPKLNVEPQNMKKRKNKGGGYNLRKSLAWDRAFFTEQGVLNPLELSMISGTSTPIKNNTVSNLNIIHEHEEEEREPTSASLAIREIEENLFKQSSYSSSQKNRSTRAVGLSPKPAPPSVAKRKVIAVNDVAGSSSKRNACPRPVASSSLKRPDTAKTPSKESKFSRIPAPKSNVSVITKTARSGMLSAGSSKTNQNAHTATNVQKYAGVKGLSKNPRTVPSNPKVDPAYKPSVTRATKQAGKYLDNSVPVTHPPSRPHQRGTGANKISEACLPEGISDTSEKRQQTHIQATKPSGLRMPSPSLAFFSQTKVSSSQSQLKQSSKPCKPAEYNIPKLRKLEANSIDDARLPHAPRKRSEIVGVTAKHHNEKLSLSDAKSEPTMQEDKKQMAGIEVRCDSLDCEKTSDLNMVNNKQMSGVKVECDSLCFEKISKKEMAENIFVNDNIKYKEHAKLHISDSVSNMGDVRFRTHEKMLLSKSHTHEQLEKEADHSSEDKSYDVLSNGDQSVFQEPPSMHHHSMPRKSVGTYDISNIMPSAVEQAEDEQSKLLTCDILTCNKSLVLQEKHDPSSKYSRHSGEFMEYNCVKTSLLNSSFSISSETVLGEPLQAIPIKNTECVNDGVDDFQKRGDGIVHLLDGNLAVHCNNTTDSILDAVNQQLPGEQLETPIPSIAGEASSKDENKSHVNSCQLVQVANLSSKGSPEKSIPEISDACENEPILADTEDCQHPVVGESGSIQRRPVDDEYDQIIDIKLFHDKGQAFELDRMSEEFIPVSATACSTKVKNVSPQSRPFYKYNIEKLHSKSELCPTVNAECDSTRNDMSIHNSCTISELQLRKDGSSRDTSMQCDIQHDVPGNLEQQASNLAYNGIIEMLCEDDSLVPNHGHSLDESELSEVSADFILGTKDSIGSGAEYPSGLSQHTLLAQSVREFDHSNIEIKESQMEEPHLSELHLDGYLLSTNTACSEEIKKENLFEGELEGGNIYSGEHDASNHIIQAMHENKDASLDVDERVEQLDMGDAKNDSTDILPLVELHLNQKVISAEFDSSTKVSEDPITEVGYLKSDEYCSLRENSKSNASDNLIFQARVSLGSEVCSSNSKSFPEEAETNIFAKEESPNTDMQHQTEGGICFAEDSGKTIHLEKSETNNKQEVPTLKPPPNVAPFSDEWLAAIEAAGEEILTMKSGAVQNSPPEKPQHEPNPWSPVKRKSQSIGPFDCTKHTNFPHSSS